MSVFVKVVQVSHKEAPHLKPSERTFYKPVRYEEPWIETRPASVQTIRGGLWALLNPDEMPTVWGFETLAEAQAVVDRYLRAQAEELAELEPFGVCLGDHDREDFHSDG